MGMIINIAEALQNKSEYNILREPINDMLKKRQEAWEQKNPIDLLFKRGSISTFQETYSSSIGFDHAFAETADYAVAPIFNTHEGFSKTYSTRTFQGGFIITKQVLEDQAYNKVKDTANQFMNRWHGDQVEYAMKAIESGFGKVVEFGGVENGGTSRLMLKSADTVDGDIHSEAKNALFSNNHTIVKRKGMTSAQLYAARQSNAFCVYDGTKYGIDVGGSDPEMTARFADVLSQIITEMENYKDDNNKYAGVQGAKRIVAPNDARLGGILNTVVSMEMFQGYGPNPAYKIASVDTTPYLRDLACCYDKNKKRGVGFFIVDDAYNAENHGPEFTQRVALTLNVEEQRNPYGIAYDARERFDINVSSWRGIVYVYIGDTAPDFIEIPVVTENGDVSKATGFNALTPVEPIDTIVKPVSVVGTVSTKAEA